MHSALKPLGRLFSVAFPSWTPSDDVSPSPPKKVKFAKSSSTPVAEHVVVALQNKIEQINDEVYLVYRPMGQRRPSVDIIFFPGFQWDGNRNEHIKTWVSRDGSELWIRWILEDIPDARIFITSYDACIRRTSEQGNMGIYPTAENLVHSLTGRRANVGQYGCPVVLVGHCVGGPVMQKLCLLAHSMVSRKPEKRVQNFLNSLRGFFFYASPFQGISQINICKKVTKGALLEYVNTSGVEASRTSSDFAALRKSKRWTAFAIGEGRAVTLGTFQGILVPEASARYDEGGFYTDATADHFDVSRAVSRTSSTFSLLTDFLAGMIKEDKFLQDGLSPSEDKFPSDTTDKFLNCRESALENMNEWKLRENMNEGAFILDKILHYGGLSATFERNWQDEFHAQSERMGIAQSESIGPMIMDKFLEDALSPSEDKFPSDTTDKFFNCRESALENMNERKLRENMNDGAFILDKMESALENMNECKLRENMNEGAFILDKILHYGDLTPTYCGLSATFERNWQDEFHAQSERMGIAQSESVGPVGVLS